MANMDSNSTAETYELAQRALISSLKQESGQMPVPEPGQERRVRPRYPFTILRWIAPYDGPDFPDKSKFFPVRCHDLSQRGFSFMISKKPEFSAFVTSFGKPPNQIRVTGKIAWCKKVKLLGSGRIEMIDNAEDDGNTNARHDQTFLVGCQFTGRVQ